MVSKEDTESFFSTPSPDKKGRVKLDTELNDQIPEVKPLSLNIKPTEEDNVAENKNELE